MRGGGIVKAREDEYAICFENTCSMLFIICSNGFRSIASNN